MGRLHLAPIGSADELIATPDHWLSLNHPRGFADLLAPRHPESHKGTYGHVLAIAGSRGKTGAAAMTGLAALRAGAGLVTVASAGSAAPLIASYAPEIMTASLPEDDEGTITASALDHLDLLRAGKTVLALGPGLNLTAGITELVADLYSQCALPLIVDADALNALGTVLLPANGPRILTPHPGEMARLLDTTTAQVQADRLNTARQFAQDRNCVLVLKGHRTLIAQPNGCVVVNSTGTPALGKGGSGDVLTGLIAGFVAQFPKHPDRSVLAAVWLHGYAAQLATATWGDKSLLATDLLTCLPEALAHARRLSHE